MSDIDLDAYCARIGYDGPRAATLEVLRALHRLHPAAIVFEGVDVLLGRPIDLSPAALAAKLIDGGRGGYCFEHNSLFKRVLEAMGFEVEALIARTRWGHVNDDLTVRTHMGLRVMLGGAWWFADVGYGGAMLTAPLRMDDRGAQSTRHEPSRFRPFGEELRQETEIAGVWRPICDIVLRPQDDVDFIAPNWFTSTHPDSRFKRNLIAAVTRDHERCQLANNRLTIRRAGGEVEQRELDAAGIDETLRTIFGLPVQDDWRPAIEWAAARSPDGV